MTSDKGARRWSLRLRVFGAVLLASLAPQLLVFAWSQLERRVPGDLWRTTLEATDAATALVAAHGDLPREELGRLASERRLRLRVLDEHGAVALDLDADDPADALHPVESFFFGARGGPTLRELDEPMGPLSERREVGYAKREGLYIACATVELLVCQGIRPTADARGAARVVHVEKSSARAVQEVYALRSRLLRLGLITVPLGLLLALWAARRMAAPLEQLRRQALDKARSASPGADLEESSDEVGDTVAALNTLLGAMARRREEEAAVAADLVHEMKSPVAAVRAGAEALAGAPVDTERAARLARVLGDSAAKLDDLVTKYLDLARVEAGMPREERSVVDLGALATAAVARARDDARFATLRFACEAKEARVMGVEGRLDAAVGELVENAASYAGGEVRVRVTLDHGDVVLRVEDDGPGIAAEDLPRVFERFFTTRGAKRGTGLGLALVRAVALAHAGRVEASSEEGGGAVFELCIPEAPAG